MTHANRIVTFLKEHPGEWFDDDELSRLLSIAPRQTVNMTCRKLAADGLIAREKQGGKIANAVADATRVSHPAKANAPTADDRMSALSAHALCVQQFETKGLRDLVRYLREPGIDASPWIFVAQYRRVLEKYLDLAGIPKSREVPLDKRIEQWARQNPGEGSLLRNHMHTIRGLGNQGLHEDQVDWSDVLVGAYALLAIGQRTTTALNGGDPQRI